MGDFSTLFLVIDALDECTGGSDENESEPLQRFLEIIFELQREHNLHIFATSRSIPSINCKFDTALSQEVKPPESDIEAYVSARLGQMRGQIRADKELREESKKTIVKAVHGM
ncbi:NACHT domain-containing protein [Cordyceps javanica]|nr:NACHT domain-containing protein [Cordyceps javanica]